MKEIKRLIKKAYNHKPLTRCQWKFLRENLGDLSPEFIVRFMPFFDWRKVDFCQIGYEKMFYILFCRDNRAASRYEDRDYWSQKGPRTIPFDWAGHLIPYQDLDTKEWMYGYDFAQEEYGECWEAVEEDFLREFPKMPRHIQSGIVAKLWHRATENEYTEMYLSHTEWGYLKHCYNMAIPEILSADFEEVTDRFIAGAFIFLVNAQNRPLGQICAALNTLGIGKERMADIYHKYIEYHPRNPYRNTQEFFCQCNYSGLDVGKLPGDEQQVE